MARNNLNMKYFKSYKEFLYIILLVMVFSCKTENLTYYTPYKFEILRPAYYTLPQDIDTLLVVSCVPGIESFDSTKVYESKKAIITAKRVLSMPKALCKSFAIEFNKAEYIPSKFYTGSMIPFESLCLHADTLCRNNNVQGIIALKDFKYREIVSGKQLYSETEVLTINNITWAFVSPTGAYQDLEQRADTISWTYPIELNSNIITDLPDEKEKLYTVVTNSSEKSAYLLTPAWQTITRIILSSRSTNMMAAAQWVEKNDWTNARNHWLNVMATGTPRDKARASLDIALDYERTDKIDSAAIWCSKAIDILATTEGHGMNEESDYANRLFKVFMKRIDERQILNKQM